VVSCFCNFLSTFIQLLKARSFCSFSILEKTTQQTKRKCSGDTDDKDHEISSGDREQAIQIDKLARLGKDKDTREEEIEGSTLILLVAEVVAVVVLFHLSVVNWGGEEIARLDVRSSDTVLVGMRQVEEQLGVPPCKQRMVVGEHELKEADEWSGCGVSDWSAVQLTIISEVSYNVSPP